MIYLDHNATSPLHPAALAAMLPLLQGVSGNASSLHRTGRAARSVVEQARAEIAALVGESDPRTIHFTSGGTEANNQAMMAANTACRDGAGGRLAVSAVEHPSVARPADAMQSAGLAVDRLAVDRDGRLRDLKLAPGTRMLSCMAANNETGNLYDIQALGRAAARVGALFHTDAVQALGKVPLDLPASGAHMASLSAHKIGGPQGVGALWVRSGHDVASLLRGGRQEHGRRSGTENVAGIVGFGAAARVAREQLQARAAQMRRQRDQFEAAVCTALPAARVLGDVAGRLPNTACLAFPGVSGEAVVMRADAAGVALSTGSACTSGSGEPSAVLLAMGLPSDWIQGAVRVTTGWNTTDEEVDVAIAAVIKAVRVLQAISTECGDVQ